MHRYGSASRDLPYPTSVFVSSEEFTSLRGIRKMCVYDRCLRHLHLAVSHHSSGEWRGERHHANTWWKPVLPKRGSVVLTSVNGNRRSHPYSQATLLSTFPIGVIPAYLKVLSGGIAGSKRIQRAVALKLPLEPKVIKFINVLVPIRCLW